MPKGRKKHTKYENYRTEQPASSDEDAGIDMTIDNCSEISAHSDTRSNQDEGATESEIEKFDDKVMELIDNLSARAAAARATALVSLRSALQRRYVGALLVNQRATLAEHIARALRRGRDAERKAAAALAPLLALQIGEEGAEEFMAEVRPALAAAAVDRTAAIDTRTECCTSLSVLCYLLEEDISEILEVMKMFETIFSGSYLKGDGSVKVSGAVVEEGVLHGAALDGWALLLTLLAPVHAHSLLRLQPPAAARRAELLEAHAVEVRMAAGGALAIAHEVTLEADRAQAEQAAAAPAEHRRFQGSHRRAQQEPRQALRRARHVKPPPPALPRHSPRCPLSPVTPRPSLGSENLPRPKIKNLATTRHSTPHCWSTFYKIFTFPVEFKNYGSDHENLFGSLLALKPKA